MLQLQTSLYPITLLNATQVTNALVKKIHNCNLLLYSNFIYNKICCIPAILFTLNTVIMLVTCISYMKKKCFYKAHKGLIKGCSLCKLLLTEQKTVRDE